MSWYYVEKGQRQGPISDGEFNSLLKKSVITPATLVWQDGMSQWRAYGEVARESAPEPQLPEESEEVMEEEPGAFMQRVAEQKVRISVNSCIQRAWQLHRRFFITSSSASFTVYSIQIFSQVLPGLGLLLGGILHGPLMGGLFWFYLQAIRHGEAVVAEVFAGFKRGFASLAAAAFLTALAVGVSLAPAVSKMGLMEMAEKGTAPVITPLSIGLLVLGSLAATYFSIAWVFALPLIIDKGLGLREAFQLSQKVALPNWWRLFLLMPAGGLLVALVAALATVAILILNAALDGLVPKPALIALEAVLSMVCFAGVFSLVPVFFSALMFAYEDLFSPAPKTQAKEESLAETE